MNELDVVARFRADVPPPDPAALARARAGMFNEPGPPPSKRSFARFAPIGALAAVAAVAVVLHLVTVSASPAAPVTDPKAVQVLLLAAAEAGTQPVSSPAGDQFIYLDTVWALPAQGFSTPIATDYQAWISVDGKHVGRLHSSTTPANLAATWTESLRRCSASTPDCAQQLRYRGDLPTDAASMRSSFDIPATGPYDAAAKLLTSGFLPPAQLSALFEAASTIEGLTLIPDAVDASGRPGVGVAVEYQGHRTELILDKTSYRYLGQTQVALDGTVDSASAQLATGVVDRLGQLP